MEEKRQKKQNQFMTDWEKDKEHNSILFENPAFYKSLANQRFMRLLKIILSTKPNS